MPRHESKAKAMRDLGMPLLERHAVANFLCSGAAVDIHSGNTGLLPGRIGRKAQRLAG